VKNYYQILGVSSTASTDEIKRAYRRLASQHHPDKGGDTARFQEIEEAYRVLSDADQRSEYDNPGVRININSGQPFDFDNIFNMFGARFQQRQAASARVMLWISLRDVAQGGKRVISVASSQGQSNVEIVIPPGVQDGDSVRYQ
jgi:DnaJ-class molecular chaperone